MKNISKGIQASLEQEFLNYGIELVNFNVNEITPPEDDPSYIKLKKALADKAVMDIKGYNYQQERAFNVLDKAAANEGSASNIIGAGMGLGMGMNMGGVFGNTMSGAMENVTPDMKPQSHPAALCPSCGETIPEGSKFCLKCGAKIEEQHNDFVKCPSCGANVPNGKFCLECGAKLEATCSKCGAPLVSGAKFCLECGNKVN